MSPQEQLAWHKAGIDSDPDGTELRAGAGASKQRSPEPALPDVSDQAPAHRVAASPGSRGDSAVQDRLNPRPVVREHFPGEPAWTMRVIATRAGFEALASQWSRLLEECVDANVFLSHDWLFSWWSAYHPDAELAIVVAEDRGRVRGIAPMMIETARCAGLSARVLRFIGDGTGETDHVNFLAARQDRRAVVRHLLDAIDALNWDIAEFNQIPESSENAIDLLAWARSRHLQVHVMRRPCPVRRLPARPEEVLAALPSRLRTSIRSSTRKLAQKHQVEFGAHTDESEIADALERFFANHASRWNGKGQEGAFSNIHRRAFYAQLTPRLLRRGWLRFFYLKLDGRPVAQQYCFALDDTVMLLQEGFDYAHASDNVGNVLRSMVFEHLVTTGARCYDFLAGSSRHKQSWSDHTVDDLRIAFARRSWRGWLLHALPLSLERAKDELRPWRDRWLARRAARRRPTAEGASVSEH